MGLSDYWRCGRGTQRSPSPCPRHVLGWASSSSLNCSLGQRDLGRAVTGSDNVYIKGEMAIAHRHILVGYVCLPLSVNSVYPYMGIVLPYQMHLVFKDDVLFPHRFWQMISNL